MARIISYLQRVDRPPYPIRTPSAVSLFLVLALLVMVLMVPEQTETKQAQAASISLEQAGPNKQISFRDRLVAGLKARLKSEVAFVEGVVDEVNAGRIPQRLVDETFFWARDRSQIRNRRGRVRRPVIYFQPAMVARAKRIGVTL